MPSLVEELQRDSLDSSVNVSDLLRKAFLVASKLKLDAFKKWADCEMNGYGKDDELPRYRTITCRLRAWNPYNGWIPVMFHDNPDLQQKLSIHYARGPVASYHDLLGDPKSGGEFIVHVGPDVQQFFNRQSEPGFEFEVSLHVPRVGVVRILDSVRNTILQWSLKLQEDGINGEGMSFSNVERDIASNKADELQRMVNYINIGHMENSAIQQDSPFGDQPRYAR
jgi:hypothetical protein